MKTTIAILAVLMLALGAAPVFGAVSVGTTGTSVDGLGGVASTSDAFTFTDDTVTDANSNSGALIGTASTDASTAGYDLDLFGLGDGSASSTNGDATGIIATTSSDSSVATGDAVDTDDPANANANAASVGFITGANVNSAGTTNPVTAIAHGDAFAIFGSVHSDANADGTSD